MNKIRIARYISGLILVTFIGLVASPDNALSNITSSPSRPGPLGFGSQELTSDSSNAWSSNGPRASIQSLAIDPGNPDIIYAGSRNGVFRSTNGGANWSAIGLRNNSINALTIDSSNPNTIYAATQNGVSKSTDGGTSWKTAGFLGITVALALNKDNPNILYAGIAEPGACFFYDRRLFKSTDGGWTWSDSFSPPINGCDNIHSLVIDPADSDTLYLANYDDYMGDTWTPLIKSTNGGSSWRPLYGPPFAALAIHPHNPNTLYAGTFDFGYYGDTRNGVLKSTDGGANWSEFNVGLTDLNVTALVIDRSGTHLHAATTSGVFDYQYSTPCADPISPEIQSFDSSGGTGSVNVTGKNECSWTAASYDSWITITSGGAGIGDGTVSYSVARNRSTLPRSAVLTIAGRILTVNQAGVPVSISSTSVAGKRLFVFGENFDPGAVILLNGEEQTTSNDSQNPKTALIARKAGKRIQAGDKLQVRNPNGSMSPEFLFIDQ